MAKPTLDEILAYYREHNLLAHADVVADIAGKLHPLASKIPEEDLHRNMAFLTVWPLVELYKLTARAVTSDLKSAEWNNIPRLNKKYHALMDKDERSDILGYACRPEMPQMHFVNPYTSPLPAFTSLVQTMAEQCETWKCHLRDTRRSHMKAIHDAQMGGTILLIEKEREGARKNSPFTFYQRSFICVNEQDEPVIFMDALQHCDGPDVSRIDHWRGLDREGNQVQKWDVNNVNKSVYKNNCQ